MEECECSASTYTSSHPTKIPPNGGTSIKPLFVRQKGVLVRHLSGGEPPTSNSTELSERSESKFIVELRIPSFLDGTSIKLLFVRQKGVEPPTLSSVG